MRGGTIVKKRIISIITSLTIILTFIGITPEISELEVNAATLTEEQFASKIASLKNTYIHGQYWNNYNGYDRTGTIKGNCSTSCAADCSCQCGKFYLNGTYYGGQCYGFANKLGYLIFGSVPTASWEKHYNKSNLKAGDYVRIDNDRHSIFITKVENGVVEYVDCNRTGPCKVRWGGTMTISSMNVTHIMHYPGNSLTGTGTTIPVDTRFSSYLPLKIYLTNNSTLYVENNGEIWTTDECKIKIIYTNGTCIVEYPTANSSKTVTTSLSAFIPNLDGGFAGITADKQVTTYSRADKISSIGYVSAGDYCIKLARNGNMIQAIYPTSSGYKCGWLEESQLGHTHSYGSWSVTKNATCTANGTKSRSCSCGATETAVINAIGHDYVDTVTSPSCVSKGYTTHKCKNCGNSYNDKEKAVLGHSWSAWTTSKASTCTTDGTKTRKCSRCGKVETATITKTGHSYTDTIVVPDCTSKGYTTHKCKNCGNSYNDTEKAALGHSWSAWTTSKASTCTTDGTKTRKCSRCGKVETAIIEATGHKYGEWNIERTENCITDGKKSRTCSKCDNVDTVITPKTGHTYADTIINSTCTEKGYTIHECSKCGDKYKDTYTDPCSHNYEVTNVDGVSGIICSTCDLKQQVTFKGEGTSESPYLMSSKEDLLCLSKLMQNNTTAMIFRNKCYKQTNNIDLKNMSWTPLGLFKIDGKDTPCYFEKGFIYDGGNYCILNLNVNNNYTYSGFFGKVNSGIVKNLAVYGSSTSNNGATGGIIGELAAGATIEKCSFNGNVNGTKIGGIVGQIWRGGNVINCYHNGELTSTNHAGGIVGVIQNKEYDTNITNCYHVGKINANISGGIIGEQIENDANKTLNINNCYFMKNSAESGLGKGTITKNDSMPLISAMLKEIAVDLGNAYSDNENEVINNGYPVFTWQLPSKIKGDINNDGAVKVADIVVMQKFLTGKHTLNDSEQFSADLNGDNKFNVFDMIILKRMVMK